MHSFTLDFCGFEMNINGPGPEVQKRNKNFLSFNSIKWVEIVPYIL